MSDATSRAPSDKVECAWQSTGVQTIERSGGVDGQHFHPIHYGILNGFVVSRGAFPGGTGAPGRPGTPGRNVVSNGWVMLNGECTVHSSIGSVPIMKYSVATTSGGQ